MLFHDKETPKPALYKIINGDCLGALSSLESNSVNLIVTSPPYGKQREDVYGGVDPECYSEWFLPRAREMRRVLRNDGSFILNIWEHVEKGQRHPYVLKLVLDMIDDGWLWIEEYIWQKNNPVPGKRKNRVLDCWEHLYHFAKTTDIKCFTRAVDVPARWDWKGRKRRNGPISGNGSGMSGAKAPRRRTRANGSGFGTTDESMIGQEVAMAHNVIKTNVGVSRQDHPATFPEEIPSFFIKLFTEPGDTVLDPFAGSGTTLSAAYKLGRKSIGIEVQKRYCDMISKRMGGFSIPLPFVLE